MKKIRLKFILIAAASLFAVLFTILAGYNISNYLNLKTNAKETCEIIIDSTENPNPFSPIVPGDKDPELFLRSRYFLSYFENDTLVKIDTNKVSRIDEKTAIQLAKAVYSNSKEEGFDGYYYYLKQDSNNGEMIIFLDQQLELNYLSESLLYSILLSTGGYLIVLLLIYLLSSFVIKPIELANEKQKQFITDASHELKTPLTIISSNLSIIEMENGKSEWIDSTKKQISRLTNMTNELVMLSKLNESNIKINKTKISLDNLLYETANPYIKILNENKVKLSLKLQSNIDYNGDASLLNKLFNVFLDNMTKYAVPGKANVSLSKRGKSSEIIFSNKVDKNSSINVINIFDRFYKEDKSRKSKTNSFGIGLSMAKAIVEAHKGKISAEVSKNTIYFKIILN